MVVQKLGRKILVLILAITLVLLTSTSCSRIFKQNDDQQQGQKGQQQEKKDPPSALTQMEKETDNMIQQIQKIRDQRAKMIGQQIGTSQKQNDGNKPQPKQQSSSQADQKQDKEKQDQQQESQTQGMQQNQIKWQNFEKTIKALNELWNKYEPQAKKDGAPDTLISQFEKQLNMLTSSIMAHDEEKTLMDANELYQYYSQFFNLYKHQAPPEIKEIKYYVQEILINAEAGKWEETATLLMSMEKAWQTAKSRMEKPDHELNAKIDHAMEDFSEVVQQKDLQLVKIKGEILLKNVEEIK